MTKTIKLSFVLLFMSLSCSAVARAEEIRVSGGGAAIAGFFRPCLETYEHETGNKMVITQNTPLLGMIALDKREADIAVGTSSLDEMISRAKKLGITIDVSKYEQTVVGLNDTLVFVHKQNFVKQLSKQQLKDIFTGKITNWKELGGNDIPVEVIWGTKTPGQNALFTEKVLDGDAVTSLAIPADDYADVRLQISSRPGAIGIDPKGFVAGMIRIVKDTPRVSKNVFAITKRNSSPKIYELLAYVKSLIAEINKRD
jgi:phosphate transport system substrate-binding protein